MINVDSGSAACRSQAWIQPQGAPIKEAGIVCLPGFNTYRITCNIVSAANATSQKNEAAILLKLFGRRKLF